MITLEKLLTELKGESLNEIVAGGKWNKKTSTRKYTSTKCSSTSTRKKLLLSTAKIKDG